MKAYISGKYIFPGKVGGAEQYLGNLLKGFDDLGLTGNFTIDLQPGAIEKLDPIFRKYKRIEGGVWGNRVVNDALFGFKTDQRKYEIAFFPNYVAPILKLGKVQVYSTIHDLVYRHQPEIFSNKKRQWLKAAHRLTLARSDKVFAISEIVRKDILKWFPSIKPEKVIAIPNAIDFARFGDIKKEERLKSDPYILSVAHMYPHKNLDTLIQAYLSLFPKPPRPIKLVLVGHFGQSLRGGSYEDYGKKISSLVQGNDDIIQTGYITDEELGTYYRDASLFCFPSKFEGFGMPPVEAMGFGVPTIVSKTASLPEVTLGKARYVEDYESVDSWIKEIQSSLENEIQLKSEFANISPEIISTYSPKSIAGKYYEVMIS